MPEVFNGARHQPRRVEPARHLQCVIITFGVLHGEPPEGDGYTVDLRTRLRNPHENPAMRHLTGLDQAVFDHVMNTDGVEEIVADTVSRAVSDLKHWGNPHGRICRVFVCCRGGRHRSVAVAEEIADRLYQRGIGVQVEHRDIKKPIVQ